MAGDDQTASGFFQPLESLVGVEPGRVISGQPALGDAWLVVFHDVGMVADKEEGAIVFEVELETDEAVGVAGEVVEDDTLGKVDGAIVKGLPVELVDGKVVREVDASVGTGGASEEGPLELALVHPDRDVGLAEVLQSTSVIEMEMADNNVLDVLDVISRLGDRCLQLVFGLILGPRKDVVNRSSPDLYGRLKRPSLRANVSDGLMPNKVQSAVKTVDLPG